MQTLNCTWIWIQQQFSNSRLQGAPSHLTDNSQSHQHTSGLSYSWGWTLNERTRFPVALCSYLPCKPHFLKRQTWRHKNQFKEKLILKCQQDHLLAFTQLSYQALHSTVAVSTTAFSLKKTPHFSCKRNQTPFSFFFFPVLFGCPTEKDFSLLTGNLAFNHICSGEGWSCDAMHSFPAQHMVFEKRVEGENDRQEKVQTSVALVLHCVVIILKNSWLTLVHYCALLN